MHSSRDSHPGHTEADHTTQTRFGPRPVPPGHQRADEIDARRTIPSGRASPDGRRSYPVPSQGARIAVWGGVALGVAGGTAAAVFALRKLVDAIGGDSRSRHDITPMALRFRDLDDGDREDMRQRVRSQPMERKPEPAQRRAIATDGHPNNQPSRKSGNFVEDLIDTSTRLSQSLEGVAKSVSVAMDGFRSVARQATGILSEFADTADQLRAALKGEQPRRSAGGRDDPDRTRRL